VRKHRGNIQVHSKPGDTRFQVWLPLADARS
jgi:nitrogen-specific signal transduction histidine kinase